MKRIIFFNVDKEDKSFFEAACDKKYQADFIKKSLGDFSEINEEMKKAEVISCFTVSKLTAEILKQFPNLELIVLRCVGFNNVDIEYCRAKNIKVVNAKGYGNRTVAEFALALIFDVARNISKSFADIKEMKNIINGHSIYSGVEIIGKTIGIIGVGAIGSELVKIANGLGMKVLGFDKVKNNELTEKYNLKYVELDELIENSDFISIHAPLTKENYHLIDESKFALMKDSAIIVNTARGELIDTKALYKALSFGTIKGAGLDVLECEETINNKELMFDMDYLDKDDIKQILLNHEITKLDNAVVTPHIAYDTKEAKERIWQITMDNIDCYFSGKIQNSVY